MASPDDDDFVGADAEWLDDSPTAVDVGSIPDAEVTPSAIVTAKHRTLPVLELARDNQLFRDGGVHVLEALQAWFVERAGLDPANAAQFVQEVARRSGVLLLGR